MVSTHLDEGDHLLPMAREARERTVDERHLQGAVLDRAHHAQRAVMSGRLVAAQGEAGGRRDSEGGAPLAADAPLGDGAVGGGREEMAG